MKTKPFLIALLCILLASCASPAGKVDNVDSQELEKLRAANEELVKKVEDLTKSNDELKKQVDELTARVAQQKEQQNEESEAGTQQDENGTADVSGTEQETGTKPQPNTTNEQKPDNQSQETTGKVNETSKGFVTKMYTKGNKYYMDIDYVIYLSGEEAEREAAKRDDEVNNDYYIVNDNKKIRTFEIAPDAEITAMAQPGNPDSYRKFKTSAFIRRDTYFLFCEIVVKNSIIVKIDECYVP